MKSPYCPALETLHRRVHVLVLHETHTSALRSLRWSLWTCVWHGPVLFHGQGSARAEPGIDPGACPCTKPHSR